MDELNHHLTTLAAAGRFHVRCQQAWQRIQ